MYDAGVRKALSTALVCKTPRSSQRAAMDDMPQKHSRERTNRIGAWEICSLTRGAWLDFCKRSITPTLGGTPTEKSSRTVRYAHSSRTRSSNPLRSSVPVTDLSRGEGRGWLCPTRNITTSEHVCAAIVTTAWRRLIVPNPRHAGVSTRKLY